VSAQAGCRSLHRKAASPLVGVRVSPRHDPPLRGDADKRLHRHARRLLLSEPGSARAGGALLQGARGDGQRQWLAGMR